MMVAYHNLVYNTDDVGDIIAYIGDCVLLGDASMYVFVLSRYVEIPRICRVLHQHGYSIRVYDVDDVLLLVVRD